MKTEPLKHQKEIQPIINSEEFFALFWDQGLGKTWVGCWLLESLKPGQRALIICPNNITEDWLIKGIMEHSNINPKRVAILGETEFQHNMTKAKRIKLLKSKADIFIMNFEGLRVILRELHEFKWDLVLIDEAHKIKNPKAFQTKAACSLAHITKRRFILTGTPILKDYMDLFSQFLFLDKGKTFGTNFYAFRNKYFVDLNARRFRGTFPQWVIKKGAEQEIKEKIAKYCHRLEKKDCLTLPPRTTETIKVYLSGEQERCYKEMMTHCLTTIGDVSSVGSIVLTKMLRVNQIAGGHLVGENGEIVRFKHNAKLEVMKEMIENIIPINDKGEFLGKNKVVIWAQYREDIDQIFEALKAYNPVKHYGGIKEKVHYIFQDDHNCRVYIGQPKKGIGTTLTAANYSFRYSYTHSAEDWWQPRDRTYRKGSEIHNEITEYILEAVGTYDKVILASLQGKTELAQGVNDFIKEFRKHGTS